MLKWLEIHHRQISCICLFHYTTNWHIMLRSWIIISVFLHLMHLSCSSNEAFNAALNACKFVKSCSTSNAMLSENSRKDSSCCRPCTCDKYCHERKLCCPDYNGSSEYVPVSNYTQMCLPAARNSLNRYRQFYFVRASCPVDFKGDHLKEACEGNYASSVDDVIFVTSHDGQVTYKNKHCALCHGEQNVQKWSVVTTHPCIKRFLMAATSSEEVNINIISNCELAFTPPPVFNNISTYCETQNKIVSTCPQNTDGRQNPQFEHMCVSIKGKQNNVHVCLYCCVVIEWWNITETLFVPIYWTVFYIFLPVLVLLLRTYMFYSPHVLVTTFSGSDVV